VDVEAIIQRADEDIAAAEARLRAEEGRLHEVEQRVEEARKHIEELRQLRQGFVLAIERYGQPAPEPDAREAAPTENPPSEPEPHPWRAMSQSDAVIAALTEIGRPATTAEIYERLVSAGRAEGSEQIRSTVGYLNRRARRIMRVDRGLWELPPSSGAPPAAGSNGHAHADEPAWTPEQAGRDEVQANREDP
jgi:hypothetical protein